MLPGPLVAHRLLPAVYYFGYREDKMISVFVNLFAAMAYWAKLASHMNGDVGPAANVVTYKYLDYVFTCPLLVRVPTYFSDSFARVRPGS